MEALNLEKIQASFGRLLRNFSELSGLRKFHERSELFQLKTLKFFS